MNATTGNRPYFTGTRLVMYQLLYLTIIAPSTLKVAGTRNYGVISILGVYREYFKAVRAKTGCGQIDA